MPIQLNSISLQTLSNVPNIKLNTKNLTNPTTIVVEIASTSNKGDIGYVNLNLLSEDSTVGTGAYSFDNSNPTDINTQIYSFLKTLPEFADATDC